MFLSIIRNFRASLVFIIQRRKNLLSMVREQATYEIKKITKKTMHIENIKGESSSYSSCPPCQEFGVDFDTYSFSSFKFKLDLQDLVEVLSGKKIS